MAAGELDPDLVRMGSSSEEWVEVPVIVHFTSPASLVVAPGLPRAQRRADILRSLQHSAEVRQGPARKVLARVGAHGVRTLWVANALAATVPLGALGELARAPGVAVVRLDSTVELPSSVPDPGEPAWGGDPAPLLDADDELTGEGVVVASMDSGVDLNHPALASRWRGGKGGWYDPNGQHAAPADVDGHGTQVMGILVGGPPGKAVGVAPGAEWIAVKIYDDSGKASLSAIHAGFQWLLDPDGDPDTDDAPDVVNGSWGLKDHVGQCVDEFRKDIRVLRDFGVATAFAAGNDGPALGTSVSPANYREGFAVGAVDEDWTVATFSARGPSACDGGVYVDVVAPGVQVQTADLTFGGVFPQSYVSVSATSFAAPAVSGAMALLLSAFPDVSVEELETALRLSAVDAGPPGPDVAYGHGVVDVLGAYELLASGVDCADGDMDGYPGGEGCGKAIDCDDGDANLYPGAPERIGDGVDQDCNGYDLSIGVSLALADEAHGILVVVASSALGEDAGLELVGYGGMVYQEATKRWVKVVPVKEGGPAVVQVLGKEGGVSATVSTAE